MLEGEVSNETDAFVFRLYSISLKLPGGNRVINTTSRW